MSISSILAFVLAGVAAKNRRADRRDENQTLVALRIDNCDLRRRVAELEDDVARANVQSRRDQELIDIWRERAQRPAGPDFRPPQIAQQQLRQAQAQMQNAQALQQYANQGLAQQQDNAYHLYNAQAQQGLGAIGLLGAQSLINAELWCNCVPSRAQVWATSDPE